MEFKQGLLLAFSVLFGVTAQPALAGDLMFGALQFRATVGSILNSSAYVAIINHGKMKDRLIDVTSNLARKTELHKMMMKNQVMKMRQVEGGIDIPAGKTTHLAPGGYHVMLMGLYAPLEADSIYEITLVFRHAGKKTIRGMAMLPSDLKMSDLSKKQRHIH